MKMLWSHFPNNFVENASPEYYENIVMTESQKAEDLMSRHRTILNEANAQLEDMQKDLDKLEQQADVLEEGLQ
jgi:phage shock protein A